ncbi:hypothetical protein QE441_003531 [Chryseobacterium sp. SORGH_AS909]|uniref:Uncharacterized protein n=1 Tax=Chryseobacterium camelliae TaxID=1265445 RepID=A0ABU0THK3_9FLAO|nr:hypothetical protein [Chryseobacterium camelliae]MDQ1100396.1 hypothetical protein [Chryseobacterium sp. SORGH_AS_1048]MDR6087737.1 hypothetical protein [Chryseobacterium sp. SORGH_AS_0909]MDR6132113.1 hypothetical protein [Chryseobacterium sp. SORGH_AS_1175]MDT3405736.1 hypothetical protein [Pseudacidovorax intermedius]
MKKLIREKNKLPLTFKYIEAFNKKGSKNKSRNSILYFVECNSYQTDCYVRAKPSKPLTRML